MTSDRLSRRDFSWAAVAAGASSLGAPGLAATPAAAKPNILFITMDELTPDVLSSPAAAHIKTPHLDALAARGALFSHTYCQGPLCQPSRASLITGAYVKQTGQSWNGFDMDPSWPTLMKSLQAAGYTTAMVGKTHFSGAMKGARANASGAIDLATITPWCQKFGLDYLLEEFDHTVHRNPRIVSPYLSWLSGKNLVDRYRAEIRTAATSSPSDPYWEGHVSSMADADQLSTYLGDRTVDWLNHYDKQKPFFMWLSFIAPPSADYGGRLLV